MCGFELRAPLLRGSGGEDVALRVTVTLVDGSVETLARRPALPRPMLPRRSGGGSPLPRAGRPRRIGIGDEVRVLFSARSFDLGGSQLRMAELVEHLNRRGGYRITVHSPSDGPLRALLERNCEDVRCAPAAPLDDAAAYESSVTELCEWIDGRFDLVYGATVTNFPAVDAATRLGIPAVLRVGEAAPLSTVVSWVVGRLDPSVEDAARHAMAGASAVVSNSAAAVRMYRGAGWSGRFVVLRSGTDVGAAHAAVERMERDVCRERLGVGRDERLLLCAGSVWRVKGQAMLVAALDWIRDVNPHLTCAMVGYADAVYAAALAQLVARRGLDDRVRILPFCNDLSPWWRAADVVVSVSESEATPAVVLEAMAHGVPVFGTRVGDLPDLIEPGVNGWLCEPSDLAALIAGLTEVAEAPAETIAALGAAAARSAAANDRTLTLVRSDELMRAVSEGRFPRWASARRTPRSVARGLWRWVRPRATTRSPL
jgi:glycosyltransferase involved in cell wall biosynthesis